MSDRSRAPADSQNPADEPDARDRSRPSTAADVDTAYMVILGRRPESEAVVREHVGQPADKIIFKLSASGEFEALIQSSLSTYSLPHSRNLTSVDRASILDWLSRQGVTLESQSPPRWWSVVAAFVAHFRMAEGSPLFSDWLELLDEMAAAGGEGRDEFGGHLAFDPTWYLETHPRAKAAIARGECTTAEEYFLARGRYAGDQLVPAFEGNLTAIYAEVPEGVSSLDPFLAALADACHAGEIWHWLFEPGHYLRARAKVYPDVQSWPRRAPYAEFLAWGDGRSISPHPLFCHHAYRLKNDVTAESLFDHFLRHGARSGQATSAIFDASYYLASNPQAGRPVASRPFLGPLHDFLVNGSARDFAFCPDFDLKFYLAEHQDIARRVADRSLASGTWHFIAHGLDEGRRPNSYFHPDYYSERYPQVADDMRTFGIAYAFEHFLLIGRAQGLRGERPMLERRPSLDEGKVIFARRAMRSLDRSLRSSLDFTPFQTDRPAVSMIVPVCGQAAFTAHFLQCAYLSAARLHAHRGEGLEIIVVDNGSRDWTQKLLSRSPGVRCLHFPEPIGYPRAINAGLAEAKADVIIVCNNDLEFPPDVVERTLHNLEDPAIGIVGPLIILPDETVQEAGSFVDRGGSIVALGRHDNPWDDYLRGVRDVDYCTGCFFAFRKEDAEALGGADEAYSPGYYEDTDFAFRMREQLGKRVVVDPEMQVVHFEHASFGQGRTPAATMANIVRNQVQFAQRHAATLAFHPEPGALKRKDEARPSAIGRSRILVVLDSLLQAECSGVATVLMDLRDREIPFELYVMSAATDKDEYNDPRVAIYRGWTSAEAPSKMFDRASRRYSHVWSIADDHAEAIASELAALQRVYRVQVLRSVGEVRQSFGLPMD